MNNDSELFEIHIHEQTLCGALMLHLHDLIRDDPSYYGYYTDVEYNRHQRIIKTIHGPKSQGTRVTCDLILHSRGKKPDQDNLIVIEMKKANQLSKEKDEDKLRLIEMTSDNSSYPEHVGQYVLGVYYEINYKTKEISVEYYHQGQVLDNIKKYKYS